MAEKKPTMEELAEDLRADAAGRAGSVRLSTSSLFKDVREVVIEHQGELYCLRITKKGKLILTK